MHRNKIVNTLKDTLCQRQRYLRPRRRSSDVSWRWITSDVDLRNLREALDAAKTAGHVNESKLLEQRAGLLQVAVDIEGNHACVA